MTIRQFYVILPFLQLSETTSKVPQHKGGMPLTLLFEGLHAGPGTAARYALEKTISILALGEMDHVVCIHPERKGFGVAESLERAGICVTPGEIGEHLFEPTNPPTLVIFDGLDPSPPAWVRKTLEHLATAKDSHVGVLLCRGEVSHASSIAPLFSHRLPTWICGVTTSFAAWLRIYTKDLLVEDMRRETALLVCPKRGTLITTSRRPDLRLEDTWYSEF